MQSRYYDPQVKRFINADDVSVLEEDQGSIVEHNLFSYCLNNPVNMIDESGSAAMLFIPVGYGVYKLAQCIVVGSMYVIAICGTAEVGSKLYKKYKKKAKKINYQTYLT